MVSGSNDVLINKTGHSAPLRVTSTEPVTAVPEPAAWAIMLLGFFGLGGALRRQQTTAAA